MSYTYSGNPHASPVDMVHFRLGNTNPAYLIATDEECAAMLDEYGGNTYLAAAAVAESKAMEFVARPSSVKRGDRTTTYDDQAARFMALAKQLRLNATIKTATVYVGGVSVGEHGADARDMGLEQPVMTRHLHEQGHGRFAVGLDLAREE